jgi:hypothetical protein
MKKKKNSTNNSKTDKENKNGNAEQDKDNSKLLASIKGMFVEQKDEFGSKFDAIDKKIMGIEAKFTEKQHELRTELANHVDISIAATKRELEEQIDNKINQTINYNLSNRIDCMIGSRLQKIDENFLMFNNEFIGVKSRIGAMEHYTFNKALSQLAPNNNQQQLILQKEQNKKPTVKQPIPISSLKKNNNNSNNNNAMNQSINSVTKATLSSQAKEAGGSRTPLVDNIRRQFQNTASEVVTTQNAETQMNNLPDKMLKSSSQTNLTNHKSNNNTNNSDGLNFDVTFIKSS